MAEYKANGDASSATSFWLPQLNGGCIIYRMAAISERAEEQWCGAKQPPKLCANALRSADTSVADQTKSLPENRRRTELAMLLLVLIYVPKHRQSLRRVWSRRAWPPIRNNPGAPVSGVGGMVPHGKMRLSLAIRLDLSHCDPGAMPPPPAECLL